MSRRERKKRRERHRGHPMKRIALVAVGLALTGAIIGAASAVGWVVAVADSAPNLKELRARKPNPLSQIFAADGSSLGYIHSDTVFRYVPGGQIPNRMKQATVAIEDRRFFQHGALDYQGILRAGIKDVFGNRTSLQGASTLTMQLVDNMYMPADIAAKHDLKYKIVQAKLAEQLEGNHPKPWILDTYLNDAPYGTVNGETARGVGAAAEIFFNKPVTQLSLPQEALLAGLPQAPSSYNPFLAPKLALRRRNEVLQAMVASHYISQASANRAARAPLGVHSNTSYSTRHEPFVFDFVVKQLEQHYGLKAVEDGGMKVYTTISPQAEQQAQNAVDQNPQYADAGTAAALASVDPSNGHIVALAATEDYGQTKFFYPVQAMRQTGSAAKVFALMTLIHDYNGDPNQTYYTSQALPAGWYSGAPTWSVHTDTNSYIGSTNITHATTISDNTVFAQLVVDLGVSKFEAIARAMGLPGSQMIGAPAEVLGGWKNGITPLQMADADAILANGGVHYEPTVVDHVVFPNGRVDTWTQKGTRVFSPGETYAATQVLKTVLGSGGTGAAADYGCPAAGKTGTAENLANAWFVGYTPKLATAVWVGFPQGNVGMSNGFGGAVAAPLWRNFMQAASNGYCGDFPPPDSYWSGSAFTGAHSSGNGPSYPHSGQSNSGTGSSTTSTNPYNNPSLYAQPTGGAGTAPSTGGGAGTTGGGAGGTTGGGTTGGGGGTGAGGGRTGGGPSGTGGTGGARSGGAGVKSH